MKKLLLLLTLLLSLLATPRSTVFSQEEDYKVYLPMITKLPYEVYLPVILNEIEEEEPQPYMYTNSYYITSIAPSNDPNKMYNLGCTLGTRDLNAAGTQDSVVILDFGSPTYKDGEYGASLLSSTPTGTATLAIAVESYAKGYYDCTGSDYRSHLTVGIGTTNYQLSGGTGWTGAVNSEHAKRWAWMVNDVNTWLVSHGYSGQVTAVGANDIELSWSSYAVTLPWLTTYDLYNLYPLYDFGDLAGCPTRLQPGWTCYPSNGWTIENAWYKAYGAPPNYPLPEIYMTYGTNARQWAYLSHWAYLNKGQRIDFLGTMTQWAACQQAGYNGCNQDDADPDNDLDNTPFQGYDQLYDELLYWPTETAQERRWSTDIMWK